LFILGAIMNAVMSEAAARFWADEAGGETIEWPLVVALIGIVAIGVMQAIGGQVTTLFSSIAGAFSG